MWANRGVVAVGGVGIVPYNEISCASRCAARSELHPHNRETVEEGVEPKRRRGQQPIKDCDDSDRGSSKTRTCSGNMLAQFGHGEESAGSAALARTFGNICRHKIQY